MSRLEKFGSINFLQNVAIHTTRKIRFGNYSEVDRSLRKLLMKEVNGGSLGDWIRQTPLVMLTDFRSTPRKLYGRITTVQNFTKLGSAKDPTTAPYTSHASVACSI
jgi:hypothetical protein